MRKFIASLVAVLVMSAGISAGTTETATAKPLSYRGQVVAGTWAYGPCVKLRKSKPGRIMYWDTVMDDTDDGKRRSVKAQTNYVKQGCRNGA